MQIYPVKFIAKPNQTEFRFDVTAKKGASTAVARIVGVKNDEMEDIAEQWSIERRGPSDSWVLTSEKPITQSVEVVVYATGACGQVCPKIYIIPEVVISEDDVAPLDESVQDESVQIEVEGLTPAQEALWQASRFVGIHAGTTTLEDFDVLVERELIELVGGEWMAK